MTALDPRSPIPLYHQLAEVLLARIDSGEYRLGARIPSEPELARTFGIGRPTVRQATDQLVQRRRLERRRGSGTFVTEPPERVDLFTLAGTMASFQQRGIEVKTTLVQRIRRIPVAQEAENPFAGQEAYHLVRLSRVRSAPVLLEEIYLDPVRFPGLGRVSLAGRSLSGVVDEHYRMRPTSADQNFRVCRPGEERAEILELAPREPVLLVTRRLHFAESRDAIYAELYCRTDQLVFSQTLTEPAAERSAGRTMYVPTSDSDDTTNTKSKGTRNTDHSDGTARIANTDEPEHPDRTDVDRPNRSRSR